MTDLIVLCADKKIEATIGGLLNRPKALEIQEPKFEIKVHPQRDPGCYHYSAPFLQPLRPAFARALVVFDRQWDGSPDISAAEMERAVCAKLQPTWGQSCGVVVIDPELEVWAWSDSPHVDEVLGWKDRHPSLREWLRTERLLAPDQVKPADPKAAIEKAVVKGQRRWTAGTCKTLASQVGLARCQDPSFGRFKAILQRWFAPGGQS